VAVLASDDFNRADAATLGANWENRQTAAARYKIVSNRAAPTSYAADTCEFYIGVAFPVNHYSQCAVFGILGTTNTNGLGPAVRVRTDNIGGGAAFLDMYEMCINVAVSNNVSLNRWVARAFTNIAQRTQAFSDGDVARLEVSGTTLRMYRNGVQLGADVVDSNISVGAPGICLVSAMTAGALEDWEGGTLVAASDDPPMGFSGRGAGW